MVVLDADGAGDAAGQALERHRVGARRRLAARAARPTAPRGWAAACGSVPVAAFTITKLSWLHRCEPEHVGPRRPGAAAPRLAHRGGSPASSSTDRGDASGTGYWSPARGRYRSTCWRSSTPDGDWSDARARGARPARGGGHRGRARRSSRRAPATTWPPRSASGLRPGDVAVSLGTSGTVYAVSDAPTADPTGAVAGFADATGRFLPLVCTLNATKVTDAVARLLGVDLDALDALALASAARRRRGRRSLPYLDGERTPEPARRDRRARRAPLATSTASSSPAPRSKASCAGCSTGSTPCRGGRRPTPTAARARRRRRPIAPRTARSSPTSRGAPSPCRPSSSTSPLAPACRPPPCSTSDRPSRWRPRGASRPAPWSSRAGPSAAADVAPPTRRRRGPEARPRRSTRPLGDFGAPWRHEVAQRVGSAGVRLVAWPGGRSVRRARPAADGDARRGARRPAPPGQGAPPGPRRRRGTGCGRSTGPSTSPCKAHPAAARRGDRTRRPDRPGAGDRPGGPSRAPRPGRPVGRRMRAGLAVVQHRPAAGRGLRGAARRGQLDRRGARRRPALPARRAPAASRRPCWCRSSCCPRPGPAW